MVNMVKLKVKKLSEIVDVCSSNGVVSQLDKDCAMELLRDIYEQFVSIECGVAPLVEEDICPVDVCDDSEDLDVQRDEVSDNLESENNQLVEQEDVDHESEDLFLSVEMDCDLEDDIEEEVPAKVIEKMYSLGVDSEEYDEILEGLCGGDILECNALLAKLDRFEDFDDTILYLQEIYSDKSSEPAIMTLVDKLTLKLM